MSHESTDPNRERVFVGFGFGAIQAGLFVAEAHASGSFDRLVVAEVVPETVAELRAAAGIFTVNVAESDRIRVLDVGPIEVFDPAVEADRTELLAAIASASEIATAVPSVDFYSAPGRAASIRNILAEGLALKIDRDGPRAVLYAAENHNEAAKILEARVCEVMPEATRRALGSKLRIVDTVIGKMSGVIDDRAECEDFGLRPFVPGASRAFLVEAFNRILISRIDFVEPFERGISVFEEKARLLPFEEAKLYGHNAMHALAAYTARLRGLREISELRDVSGALPCLRGAFLDESGAALVERWRGDDTLFTWDGYRDYANDLLDRMTNPHLHDRVERVGRDPARKLAWSDRLVGVMRLALEQNIPPRRYGFGAAAALAALDDSILDRRGGRARVAERLAAIWGAEADEETARRLVDFVDEGRKVARTWRDRGFCDLDLLFSARLAD